MKRTRNGKTEKASTRTRNTRRHGGKAPTEPPDLVPSNPQEKRVSRLVLPACLPRHFPTKLANNNKRKYLCLPVAKVATWPIGQPFFWCADGCTSIFSLSQLNYVLMAHKLISQFPFPSLSGQLRQIFRGKAREFGMPTNWVRCREMGMPVISSWVYWNTISTQITEMISAAFSEK